jgi:hypothetical protein
MDLARPDSLKIVRLEFLVSLKQNTLVYDRNKPQIIHAPQIRRVQPELAKELPVVSHVLKAMFEQSRQQLPLQCAHLVIRVVLASPEKPTPMKNAPGTKEICNSELNHCCPEPSG